VCHGTIVLGCWLSIPRDNTSRVRREIADDLLQVRLTIVDPLTSVLNAIAQGHVLHAWVTEDYRKDDTILSYFTAVSVQVRRENSLFPWKRPLIG
jgi:hypothetical protein